MKLHITTLTAIVAGYHPTQNPWLTQTSAHPRLPPNNEPSPIPVLSTASFDDRCFVPPLGRDCIDAPCGNCWRRWHQRARWPDPARVSSRRALRMTTRPSPVACDSARPVAPAPGSLPAPDWATPARDAIPAPPGGQSAAMASSGAVGRARDQTGRARRGRSRIVFAATRGSIDRHILRPSEFLRKMIFRHP